MATPEIDPDPKGLIRESYRIEGISAPECRSIFLDWALSVPEGLAPAEGIRALLSLYGDAAPGHPMTRVLTDGLADMPAPRRRGGARARNGRPVS